MKLAIANLPESWRGITRNRDIERSAREWMDGYDAALAYCAEQLDSALSHAAGQDGEQCRAASGELDELRAWKAEHQAFLMRLSVALVVDGGCKQDQIEACVDELIAERDNLRALSRGVPEGMVPICDSVPPDGETVVVSWLDNGQQNYALDFWLDGGWHNHNEDYEHFVSCAPPNSVGPSFEAPYTHWQRIAALAAQRKEGDSNA